MKKLSDVRTDNRGEIPASGSQYWKTLMKRSGQQRNNKSQGPLRRSTTVAAAVYLALYGLPHPAVARADGLTGESVESAAAEADLSNKATIRIPAQRLGAALQTLSTQRAVNVVFLSEDVEDRRTKGVLGSLTVDEALKQLLNGTGLTYQYIGDETVSILPLATAPATSAIAPKDTGARASQSEGRHYLAQATPSSPTRDQGPSGGDEQKSQTASVQSQRTTDRDESTLAEVVVTANRRAQTLEEVPYSITAVSAAQIANTGVTDLASLTSQVPGLSVYDLGAGRSALVSPIIRGLNTDSPLGFRSFAQAPVGIYIGNSPLDGYFQLEDIQRVEVLRGPQGTLYGAGALGGALRIIPNAPVLNSLSGNVELGGGHLDHAGSSSYTASAMLNVPVGDTLAFRASGKYAYEPGFIDVYGILKRPGPFISAIPVLANPADPVNSPGIFTGKSNWNDQSTFTGRASALWKPGDKFNAELAFIYSDLSGDGGRFVNPDFQGGAYPIDPRITFPHGGNYQVFSAVDQLFSRRTALTSLDLSYDLGFATVSSTSSYATASGTLARENGYTGFTSFPAYVSYYAGSPINPRYVVPYSTDDSAHTFTQEVRLVSTSRPDQRLDYVVGMFYEDQKRDGSQSVANPGSPERSIAQGCTAPYFFGGQFPNCKVLAGPNDLDYFLSDSQHFRDVSEFGELTWHFVTHGQVTVGVRHFGQRFSDVQVYNDWTFQFFVPERPQNSTASKTTWKINPSYEYLPDQRVYALWSQGFRRGGVNALPLAGPFAEFPFLLSYTPDTVNNYETGLKGRLSSGLTYAFDVFDIEWDKPQIEGQTPAANYAVWNANKARSTGAELDISSPLPLPGLSISAGGSYANARLTEDYVIAADHIGNIVGRAGQQLPGSPKVSAAVTINYKRKLGPGYDLTVSLNDTYRSGMYLSLPTSTSGSSEFGSSARITGMNIANVSASVNHGSWSCGAYVTNLANKRVVLSPPSLPVAGSLTNNYFINQPREVFVRLGYSFGAGRP
jgi:outer membrane receptor protein involved in Fe transport